MFAKRWKDRLQFVQVADRPPVNWKTFGKPNPEPYELAMTSLRNQAEQLGAFANDTTRANNIYMVGGKLSAWQTMLGFTSWNTESTCFFQVVVYFFQNAVSIRVSFPSSHFSTAFSHSPIINSFFMSLPAYLFVNERWWHWFSVEHNCTAWLYHLLAVLGLIHQQ